MADTPNAVSGVVRLSLEEMHELSADDLAELFQERCELVIEGALSEWGSHLEEFIHKLERGVNRWHEVGKNKMFVVHFMESAEAIREQES